MIACPAANMPVRPQPVTHDGKNKWLLEVIDEFRDSTSWHDPFDTEQDALDEAARICRWAATPK